MSINRPIQKNQIVIQMFISTVKRVEKVWIGSFAILFEIYRKIFPSIVVAVASYSMLISKLKFFCKFRNKIIKICKL